MTDQKASLGDFLREIRMRNRWTLSEVSAMTRLAKSTLSKVENNQMSLTYDRIVQLAEGLKVDIVELFGTQATEASASPLGRRTITRAGDGRSINTKNYDYLYLCTDISKKSIVPMLGVAHARTLEEFGPFNRHAGEEYAYVVEGEMEVHTEHYEPVVLKVGDSIYFDATMGHAYVTASKEPARFLSICSSTEKDLIDTIGSSLIEENAISKLAPRSNTRQLENTIRK